jgi:hypothetical protein
VIPDIDSWQSVKIDEIQDSLGDFHDWCLCGGLSLDWFLGKTTRDHGDTDIGVFRSDLGRCLHSIGASRVYLCIPAVGLTSWDGGDVPEEVHDIWVADPGGSQWVLQIMVYDDDGDTVVYRRNRSITWGKGSHTLDVRGVRILNPLVTILFKANRPALEPKDAEDIKNLIREMTVDGDTKPQSKR